MDEIILKINKKDLLKELNSDTSIQKFLNCFKSVIKNELKENNRFIINFKDLWVHIGNIKCNIIKNFEEVKQNLNNNFGIKNKYDHLKTDELDKIINIEKNEITILLHI